MLPWPARTNLDVMTTSAFCFISTRLCASRKSSSRAALTRVSAPLPSCLNAASTALANTCAWCTSTTAAVTMSSSRCLASISFCAAARRCSAAPFCSAEAVFSASRASAAATPASSTLCDMVVIVLTCAAVEAAETWATASFVSAASLISELAF